MTDTPAPGKVRGLRFVLLGIYFVHVIVIETLAMDWLKVNLNGQTFLSAIAIPVTSALVLAISAAITMTLKRIPIVRAIVP